MCDEEMHNLYPAILNKQMSLGFEAYTGRRSMIYSSGGYTGIQRFSATWAGDTGGGPKSLVSMLNHGLSGHSNTSCDMDVFTAEGIHCGFFQTWSQLSSWAYWRHPWFLTKPLKETFRFYATLRNQLIPYIYTAAHQASTTGFPVMRAMSLVYPELEQVDTLLHQYMFGEFLLVGAFCKEITLPSGRWIDAWTDESIEGGQQLDVVYPSHAGGALFIKEAVSYTHLDVYKRQFLTRKIGNYLEGKACEVFTAPFDVYLQHEDEDTPNIVQPDLMVICDRDKITKKGCIGAPTWIIEIVSPSTSRRDYLTKLNLYAEYGVKEYWIVNPDREAVTVYQLDNDLLPAAYTFRDTIKVYTLADLSIDFTQLDLE